MTFNTLLRRRIPVSDPTILNVGKLRSYVEADQHYRPEVWVYFDFVRRTTATAAELTELDFTLRTPGVLPLKEVQNRINFYYEVLWEFSALANPTDRPFLTAMPARVTGAGVGALIAKQNFINEVLHFLQTNVSVSLNTTSPGSANATFRNPSMTRRVADSLESDFRHDDNPLWNHFFERDKTGDFTFLDQLFGPHTWVYVYGQGRTDPNFYYPMFTGLTNTVGDSNSSGFQEITVSCEDTLKFLHKTQLRINPALADPALGRLQSVTGTVMNIIGEPLGGATLEETFEFMIAGEPLPDSVYNKARAPLGVLDYKRLPAEDVDEYYSTQRIPAALAEASSMPAEILAARRSDVHWNKLVIWGVDPFVPYRAILPTKAPSFFTSDFVYRYEACKEIAQRVMCEFYADPMGGFVVHPYRHAIPFLSHHADGPRVIDLDGTGATTSAYVLSERDMLTGSFTVSDEEIITVLAFTGEPQHIGSTNPALQFLKYRVLAISEPLVERYGFWFKEHSEPLVNTDDVGLLELFALGRLAYTNKDAYSGQATMKLRPEMQLARPVWLPERRDVGYITSIDHNCPSKGEMTTGVSLTYLRKTDQLPVDFTEFLVQTGAAPNIQDEGELAALIELFKQATGFLRTDPSDPILGAPRSTVSTRLAEEIAARAAQAAGKSTLENRDDIVDTAGREDILRALRELDSGPGSRL